MHGTGLMMPGSGPRLPVRWLSARMSFPGWNFSLSSCDHGVSPSFQRVSWRCACRLERWGSRSRWVIPSPPPVSLSLILIYAFYLVTHFSSFTRLLRGNAVLRSSGIAFSFPVLCQCSTFTFESAISSVHDTRTGTDNYRGTTRGQEDEPGSKEMNWVEDAP